MASAASDEDVDFAEAEALSLLNTAFLLAGETLTAPGLAPEERLTTLMECHGDVRAALGPQSRLPFREFRAKLRGPIRDMLPSWISMDGLEEVRILDADGYVTEDAFDLRWENAELLNMIRRLRDFSGGRVSADQLRNHLAQQEVFEAISGRGPEQYVRDRMNLIEYPSGGHTARPR